MDVEVEREVSNQTQGLPAAVSEGDSLHFNIPGAPVVIDIIRAAVDRV